MFSFLKRRSNQTEENKSVAQNSEATDIIAKEPIKSDVKTSWLSKLKSGLTQTSTNITRIFKHVKIDESLFVELETALILSDAGVQTSHYLISELRKSVKANQLTESHQVKSVLRELLISLLKPLEKPLILGRAKPLIMMITGVNGVGKTTTIGKLTKQLQKDKQSVLLAAGDTFRAAAQEQLVAWGERNSVTVIEQQGGDPAAVIFDAVKAGATQKIDVVIADTAGRLPNQLHLMEELKKIKRVISKAQSEAPHEILLVIDANSGQNALTQVKAFHQALDITGLIMTKLDGTAKGGIVAAIAKECPIPIYFIGIGEQIQDLQPFSATEFSNALLGFEEIS